MNKQTEKYMRHMTPENAQDLVNGNSRRLNVKHVQDLDAEEDKPLKKSCPDHDDEPTLEVAGGSSLVSHTIGSLSAIIYKPKLLFSGMHAKISE